jgi:hypothetical protein
MASRLDLFTPSSSSSSSSSSLSVFLSVYTLRLRTGVNLEDCLVDL